MSENSSGLRKCCLPSIAYKKLYEKLEAKIRGYLTGNDKKLAGEALWFRFLEKMPDKFEGLFQSLPSREAKHFLKKQYECGTDISPVSIDKGVLCDAFVFIGVKLTEEEERVSLLTGLGSKFLRDEFPKYPEFMKYLYSTKAEMILELAKISEKEDNDPFNRYGGRKSDELVNSHFTAYYTQGEMADYGIVKLTLTHPNTLVGEYIIFYQQHDGSYPDEPEHLALRGYYIEPDIVSLTAINLDPKRIHAGNLLFICDSDNNLVGNFVVDYRGIPPERVGERTGAMTLTFTTETNANKFLQDALANKPRRHKRYVAKFDITE